MNVSKLKSDAQSRAAAAFASVAPGNERKEKIKDAAILAAKCTGVAVGWGAMLGVAVVTMHKVAGAFGVEAS